MKELCYIWASVVAALAISTSVQYLILIDALSRSVQK
jgi:hypothetical protein